MSPIPLKVKDLKLAACVVVYLLALTVYLRYLEQDNEQAVAGEAVVEVLEQSDAEAWLSFDEHIGQTNVDPTSEKRILQSLQTKMDVAFEDAELALTLGELAQQADFKLHIKEGALAEDGIALNEPVTLHLKNVSIETALHYMLMPLGLTWVIKNDLLQITTEIDAEEVEVSRTYNVRKLAAAIKFGLSKEKRFDQRRHYGGLGGHYGDVGEEVLTGMVYNLVSGPWFDEEGVGGSVFYSKGLMTIRQTHRAHRDVSVLFAGMEYFLENRSSFAALRIRRLGYPFDEDDRIQKLLQEPISVDFEETSLFDVIESLRAILETPVFIQENAFAEDGIALDEKIALHLINVPASSVIKLILEPLGCTAQLHEGVLNVTTAIDIQDNARNYSVVLYDIRPLVQAGAKPRDLLMNVQTSTPGPWFDDVGVGGHIIDSFPGMLACWQTEQNHHEIAKLLADLARKYSYEQY